MSRTDVPNYLLPIDPDIDLVELRDILQEDMRRYYGDMDKADGMDDYAYYQGLAEATEVVLKYLTDADQPLEVDGADAEHSLGKMADALPPSYKRHIQRVQKRLAYLEGLPDVVAKTAGRPIGYHRGRRQ